jgi:hydroxypyruvate reductase
LKPGDAAFDRVQNLIVGSNLQAAMAAVESARVQGFNPYLITADLQGEAKEAGMLLSGYAHKVYENGIPVEPPACLIAGGETTVTLHGNGLGGRNQELALSAVKELSNLENTLLITLATDGEDGPTQAAGAVVSGNTNQRAKVAGMDPEEYLARNDAFHFFEQLDDLLITGSTGTNVNDLAFLFIDSAE